MPARKLTSGRKSSKLTALEKGGIKREGEDSGKKKDRTGESDPCNLLRGVGGFRSDGEHKKRGVCRNVWKDR